MYLQKLSWTNKFKTVIIITYLLKQIVYVSEFPMISKWFALKDALEFTVTKTTKIWRGRKSTFSSRRIRMWFSQHVKIKTFLVCITRCFCNIAMFLKEWGTCPVHQHPWDIANIQNIWKGSRWKIKWLINQLYYLFFSWKSTYKDKTYIKIVNVTFRFNESYYQIINSNQGLQFVVIMVFHFSTGRLCFQNT